MAIKRVIVLQIKQLLSEFELTKAEIALRTKTSRSAIERLLDPYNTSVTLHTLGKAVNTLGKKLSV